MFRVFADGRDLGVYESFTEAWVRARRALWGGAREVKIKEEVEGE